MVKQKYNYRFFIKPSGRVHLRVRWDKKETSCSLAVCANPEKWDFEHQQARRNTTHEVNGETYPSRIINREIDKATNILTDIFDQCDLRGEIPSVSYVKAELSSRLMPEIRRCIEIREAPKPSEDIPSLDSLHKRFLVEYGRENNWTIQTRYKYGQVWTLLNAFEPKIELGMVNKQFFNDFKCWLIDNGYKNSSITKYFRYLKCIFRWIGEQGYPVAQDCFSYKTKLAVPMKSVIYLKYEEVLRFENFEFPENKQYLARARDYFCFMCYTSLRYSDLKGLKKAAITDNCIDMYAQKTKGRLKIPLVRHAVDILKRYVNTTQGEFVFQVPSNQKLNDFIKEAAEMVGLDREIVETTFCGTERIELVRKLYETISCHDARRTFVCISLSLGIPQTVVMSITGHADYETMKPYIAVSDETSKQELVKWEIGSVRNRINKLLDEMDEEQLSQVLNMLGSL